MSLAKLRRKPCSLSSRFAIIFPPPTCSTSLSLGNVRLIGGSEELPFGKNLQPLSRPNFLRFPFHVFPAGTGPLIFAPSSGLFASVARTRIHAARSEHYYALLLPGATRTKSPFQCIARRLRCSRPWTAVSVTTGMNNEPPSLRFFGPLYSCPRARAKLSTLFS